MRIKKRLVTILALSLSICVLINFVGVNTEANYDKNVFADLVVMDEEGNVEIIAYEDIDTPDQEELDELAIETEDDSLTSVILEAGITLLTNIFSMPRIEVSAVEDDTETDGTETDGTETDDAGTTNSDQSVSENNYAVVVFPSGVLTYYTDYKTGSSGYLTGGSAPDAAYVKTIGDYTIFMQSGVLGKVKTSDVTIISLDEFEKAGKITSIYTCTNGRLYHKITTNLTSYASTQIVGYQQDYMTNGATYYSYDGHYFYNTYEEMVDDYAADTYTKAINANEPYYNYYQYLSHRTKTNFTEEQIDAYIKSKVGTESKLYDTASMFFEAQETYGVNAVLMLGVAINESAWGKSSIALSKNNLFGHAAYDSSTSSATGYSSVSESINYHAYGFLSSGYIYIDDWRYFGPHLGNKESGINVKYASDPYWGEKAAAYGFLIEDAYSDATYDYNAETVAIMNEIVVVYTDPSTESNWLYSTANSVGTADVNNTVAIILEQVTGQTLYGSNVWYKVQSDSSLLDDRSAFADKATIYDFDRDYGYIHSSDVAYLSEGEKIEVSYLVGDVNMDGVRSAMDYALIKSHILGKNILTGTPLIIADVNEDGKISAMDYALIKSHILGKTNLDE